MEIKKFQVVTPHWVFRRKTEIMYLVLGPDGAPKFKDILELGITEPFVNLVTKYVNAHINEGVMPPQEISSAVLNIADDVLSGRTPTIRAGDYIAIHQFMRKK